MRPSRLRKAYFHKHIFQLVNELVSSYQFCHQLQRFSRKTLISISGNFCCRCLPCVVLRSRPIWRRSVPLRRRLERSRMRHSRIGLSCGRLFRPWSMRRRQLQVQAGLERRVVQREGLRRPQLHKSRSLCRRSVLLQGWLERGQVRHHGRASAQVLAELFRSRSLRS